MTEMMQVIAEAEGVRTPKRKRTQKELTEIFEKHQAKKAAKKAAASKSKTVAGKAPRNTTKKATTAKTAAADLATAKAATKTAAPAKSIAPIPMNFVSPDGFIREVGYDAQGKMLHIGFKGSTWATASDKAEWDSVEKAIADPEINFDTWYRKAFRGRFPSMVPVRKSAEVSA